MKAGILIGNPGNRRAGIANYVHNLISELSVLSDLTTISYRSCTSYPGVNNYTPAFQPLPFSTVLWSAAISLHARKLQNLDLVHNPSQYPLPLSCHSKYLMTIHDITAITMPEYHTRYRTLYSKAFMWQNINRASHLITDSECIKRDIIRYFNINPDKITVIPLAADESFSPCSKSEIMRIRNKYHLKNPFILFVGTLEPRKNIPTLLTAYKDLIHTYPEYDLVIAGQKGWRYQGIFQKLDQLDLQSRVKFLTYVPQEDLPALYSASVLFVLPSWYEGFGLPPLEAMQCGVPVIVSDQGSLPEIVGSGGCMIPPNEPRALMEAMEMFLTDKNVRENQVRYNLERAKIFSWKRCAQETMKVYQQVLE